MPSHDTHIRTARLLLHAASREDITAERQSLAKLADRLHVTIPDTWPPEGMTDDVLVFFERSLAHASEIGWWTWYVILRDDQTRKNVLIGTIGFKGRPDQSGAIEIGYGLLAEYHGKRYATEAARALIDWAWRHDSVTLVVAETTITNVASQRVLLNNGFAPVGPAQPSGAIRYYLARPAPDTSA